MMHVLLESSPARAPRRTAAVWTAVSFVTHASLLTAGVILTARVAVDVPTIRPEVAPPVYRAPIPETPVRRAPVTPNAPVDRPTITLPDIPTVPVVQPTLNFNATEIPAPVSAGNIFGSPAVSPALPVGEIALPEQVDRVVVPRASNPRPVYPNALRNAVVEGDVVIRFVVDTTGRVERNSVEVLRASHSLFADAVREWLPRTRYEPATIAGRPVRQLVEQSVGFTLKR